MPELHEDLPALGVHGIGDLRQPAICSVRVQAGRVLVALALVATLRWPR